jgi:hypothetical protein
VVCIGTLAVVIVFILLPLAGIGLMALALFAVVIGWLASRERGPEGGIVGSSQTADVAAGEKPAEGALTQIPGDDKDVVMQTDAAIRSSTLQVYGAGSVLSCFSPTFYYHAVRHRVIGAVGFLFLFGMVITGLQMGNLIVSFMPFRAEIAQAFEAGNFPEITISNGEATIHGPEPFVVFDEDRTLAVLDTTGEYTPEALISRGYNDAILLTESAVVIFDEDGLDITELGDLHLLFGDPIEVNAKIVQRWLNWFLVIAFIGLAIWNTLVRLAYLALVGLIVWGIAALIRRGTNFRPVYITGLYVIVPTFYARFLLAQASLSFFGLFTLLLLPLWTIALVAVLAPRRAGVIPYSIGAHLRTERPLRAWRALIALPLLVNVALEAIFEWGSWYLISPLAMLTVGTLLAASLWPLVRTQKVQPV